MRERQACIDEAHFLYHHYILRTGFSPPETYADLLLFVELSGGGVVYHEGAPDDFGLQFGDWIVVTGSPRIADRARMLILAHEWCHWLRRRQAAEVCLHSAEVCFRFYDLGDEAEDRGREEDIAVTFARLF